MRNKSSFCSGNFPISGGNVVHIFADPGNVCTFAVVTVWSSAHSPGVRQPNVSNQMSDLFFLYLRRFCKENTTNGLFDSPGFNPRSV